jgi:hypothetical protein
MRTSVLLISCLLCMISTACAKSSAAAAGSDVPADDGGDGGYAAAPAGDDGVAVGGLTASIVLPKVGLQADAPAETTISEMFGMDMVEGPHLVATTVENGDDKPKTGDDALEDAEIYTPQNPKVETLADGYVLTFTNVGGLGTNYWVNARREIDGVAYWCTAVASTQEQSDSAVVFCKSLRK